MRWLKAKTLFGVRRSVFGVGTLDRLASGVWRLVSKAKFPCSLGLSDSRLQTSAATRRQTVYSSPTPNAEPRTPNASAFTLFEVSISLLLVSFGVISVLMVFPMGLKQAHGSRAKILAAAKAVEMIDLFSGAIDSNSNLDTEAPEAWEAKTYAYSNSRWDLEQRICNFRFGIYPLPLDIARRLDSDGGEIQRILDDGGHLYYAMPTATSGLDSFVNASPPNEAQTLVFAIAGYAQHNAINRLPQKAWPYYYPYPSPPMYSGVPAGAYSSTSNLIYKSALWTNAVDGFCWESFMGKKDPNYIDGVNNTKSINPKLNDLWQKSLKLVPDIKGGTSHVRAPERKAYANAAIDYCDDIFSSFFKSGDVNSWPITKQGISLKKNEIDYYIISDAATSIDGQLLNQMGEDYDNAFAQYCLSAEISPSKINDLPNSTSISDSMKIRSAIALRVQIMRFLSSSFTTLYHNTLGAASGPTGFTTTNKRIFPDKFINSKKPTINEFDLSATLNLGARVTPQVIRYLHERCLFMAMRYAASFPYDWGQPRPQQRSIMTDFPLIELDLFTTAKSGSFFNEPLASAAQWKPIAAQPITNAGPSASYPTTPLAEWTTQAAGPSTDWGDPTHFTLTKEFQPAERCRQIVFWSVDWQQYEDFETAQSAPVDASRHTLSAYRTTGSTLTNLTQRLNGYGNENSWNVTESYLTQNPELTILFPHFIADKPTGFNFLNEPDPAEVNAWKYRAFKGSNKLGTGSDMQYAADSSQNIKVLSQAARQYDAFIGKFGADRNGNGILDRGPRPQHIRTRALSIARFNYYDPRIPTVIR